MVCICLWTLYTQLRFITADIVIVINSLSPWHFYCIYMCMNFVHSCVWQLFLKNKRWDEMSMLQKLQLMNKKLSYCRATMQAIDEWSLGSCKVVGIIASRWATRDFLLVWYCNYLCLVTWSWIRPLLRYSLELTLWCPSFLFCKSSLPQPFLFLLQDSLYGFPRLFTVTSEHIHLFYFLVFFLFLNFFSCRFCAVD